jgi:hypothetical protein
MARVAVDDQKTSPLASLSTGMTVEYLLKPAEAKSVTTPPITQRRKVRLVPDP